jgi:hypothetical protein
MLKSAIFWDTTSCSPLKINRHFAETYRLHLQGRRISRARNQSASRWQAGLCSFFDPEDGSYMFLRNVGCFQRTKRGVIPQDSTLHNHRCENLKSYILNVVYSLCKFIIRRPKRINAHNMYVSTLLSGRICWPMLRRLHM